MTFVLITCFFIALTGLAFHRMHFLSALLCLEAMMLVIFLSLALWPDKLSPSMLMAPLIMLTLSACEAALALSLMIAMARSHGNDKLKTLNLLRC
uniref:NADH-ubiquinone oxidoreductase chain 4L n=2 Tax=Microhylidae TaxID=8427 RepID=S4V232_9NEOB|nr:NADH dehydrogenase subunit 4L [Cophixalus sp. TNHC 54754]AVP25555.1 NADH dehydrogenase subunit 4L [Hylophorbus sp. TNHC-GDC 31221]